jgi:serine phosphatase RsbU (regulator of sigma subunit)
VTTLDSTGMPLGIIPDAPVGPGPALELAAGDVLLFVSDGIFECDTASGELGIDAVLETARQHLHEPAPALLASLKALTEKVSATGHFRDDRTAVAAKRIG